MHPDHIRAFPIEVRESAVQRYLSTDISYRQLAKEVGASTWTLRGWVKRYQGEPMSSRKKDTARSTNERTSQEKLNLLLKARSLPDDQLGEFLRREGIREGDLERWEQDALSGFERAASSEVSSRQVRELEQRVRKNEKRLKEANALLNLQKKVQALWVDEDDDTSRS